jgi:hypothetical protein
MPFMTSRSILISPARSLLCGVLLSMAALAPVTAKAQVYRCPGQVLTYTDQLTVQQAKERGCTALERGPITVVQGGKPRPMVGGKSPASDTVASSTPRAADSKVNASEQRERDSDARRILDGELKREESKLAELKKDFNNGEPERQGGERNYAKYQERVEEMKQAIARKEADIAAIRKELGNMPGGDGGRERSERGESSRPQ